MAELVDLNKNNKFILLPLRYEEKEEGWFSVQINITKGTESSIKGFASLQVNDWRELIEGIEFLVIKKKTLFFIFEPIEPYLKIIVKAIKDRYLVEVYFCKGPIFEPYQYKELQIMTSEEKLLHFIQQINAELKRIDSQLQRTK